MKMTNKEIKEYLYTEYSTYSNDSLEERYYTFKNNPRKDMYKNDMNVILHILMERRIERERES